MPTCFADAKLAAAFVHQSSIRTHAETYRRSFLPTSSSGGTRLLYSIAPSKAFSVPRQRWVWRARLDWTVVGCTVGLYRRERVGVLATPCVQRSCTGRPVGLHAILLLVSW
jgi:hypothetical protein